MLVYLNNINNMLALFFWEIKTIFCKVNSKTDKNGVALPKIYWGFVYDPKVSCCLWTLPGGREEFILKDTKYHLKNKY